MLSDSQQGARPPYRILPPLLGEAQVRCLIRRPDIQAGVRPAVLRFSPSEKSFPLSPDDTEHASSPSAGLIQAGVFES